MRSRVSPWLLASALCLAPFLAACTEAGLYQWRKDPYQANKLTVSGTVCTDDPLQRNFPVKILFMIDGSGSVHDNDPFGNRGKAVDEIIGRWGKVPNYWFAVVSFAGTATNHTPQGFTRDATALQNAIAMVSKPYTPPCSGTRCRDLRSALSLASSMVTGDLLAGDPGEIARTTYLLVLFAGGPPMPPLGRCPCRDKGIEEKLWGVCKWSDCEGCRVKCFDGDFCEGSNCYPACKVVTPATPENQGCPRDQYCDNYNCLSAPSAGSPRPTVPFESPEPIIVPDTFSQTLKPPADPKNAATCPKIVRADDASLCVFNKATGTGNNDSCEERTLVGMVRELKDFAKKNGAAQLQLHATYLPDQVKRQAGDQWLSVCGQEADQARAVRLLSEMAYAGDGNFLRFGDAAAISFVERASSGGPGSSGLDFHTSRDPLVIKELVATNVNVLADSTGSHIDTDADGVTDDRERELGTCASDEDTDGDGMSDFVEMRLAYDPLKSGDRIECVDLPFTDEHGTDPCGAPNTDKQWRRYKDKDGDGLNACEERLLGTGDSLMDSDADGLPDKVEMVAGTNYLAVDQLVDSDMDGTPNRDEIRAHTDPRSNDSQSALDLAYRYEEVDEGVKPVLSFSQPATITGVSIKNVSASTGTGPGYLKFNPGPPPTLAWKDPADVQAGGDFGPAVEVSRPVPDGFKLTSCRKGSSGACSPESADRFITVMVEGPASYPPADRVDTVVISSAIRNCLRFRVRNITLMETGMHRVLKTPGNNTVKVFFSEAPRAAKDGYGIFRTRDIQLNYRKGPPETRTPREAEITIADDDFTIKQ